MKTVGVIFGGRSTEHDVSIVTAIASVITPLKLDSDFDAIAIYIAKDGSWYSEPQLAEIDFYTSDAVEHKLKKLKKLHLEFNDGLSIIKPGLSAKKTKLDVVFPAMHGTYGEDGSLMGLLRMAGVPFVGMDMAGSVIAMDKVFSKELATKGGCPSNAYIWFTAHDYAHQREKLLKKMKTMQFPLFIKPAHMGSSIGLSKVNKAADLENSLEVAFHYDDKVLVEEAVPNLVEVTLPIMGNDGELTPAYLEQAVLNEDGMFDFDTKYMHGGKKGMGKGGLKGEQGAQGYSIIPADLPKDLYDAAVQVGLQAFRVTGCEGFGRVDMLIDRKAKKVYFNEINPMPGSLYTHNWKKAGVSNLELITRLIGLAEDRAQRQQRLNTVFETNFLSQF